MKKLLSILTITSLTASVPAPLIANTVQTRVKRDAGTTAKDVATGFDIKIKNENWNKISSQDKPFNTVDNKYYIVVWKGDNQWNINYFYNSSGGNYYVVDEKSQINLLFKKKYLLFWNKRIL